MQRRQQNRLASIFTILCLTIMSLEPLQIVAQGIINEIHYHPASDDDRDEFIEIYNPTTAPIDLSGWELTDGVRYKFPGGASIPSNGYLVIVADPDQFSALHPEVPSTSIFGPWQGRLSNRGETIRLATASGDPVDRATYANEGAFAAREWLTDFQRVRGIHWLAPHDGGGHSLELHQWKVSNNLGANWSASSMIGGTPATINSRATINIAPIVSDVVHSPAIPTSSQTVQILFELTDESIATVSTRLFYAVDEGPWQEGEITRLSTSNHTQAIFQGVVPPQNNNAVVEFYLQASDGSALSRQWPPVTLPDGNSDANALYQVDDRPRSPEVPDYRIIMTPSERQRFSDTVRPRLINPDGSRGPENPQIRSDGHFHATFISHFDGRYQVRYRTDIRNRGNGSRQRSPNNFRIDFASDALWNGVEKLNCNAQFPWLQTLGATLSHHIGLLAAPSRLVRVYLNESLRAPNAFATYEMYAANDVMNSDFAARQGLANANIYRGIRKSGTEEADFQFLGNDPAPYRRVYFKETNKIEDDWSDLIALTRTFSETSDEAFEAEIEQQIDVRQWMRYFAAEAFYANQETALGNGYGDDYYMYRSDSDHRFRLIPYDHDTILGQGDTGANPSEQFWRATRGAAINRLITWPTFAPIYYSSLVDLASGPFSPSEIGPLIKRLLAPSKVPETRKDQMIEFAKARSAFILQSIPRSLSIAIPFPQEDGVFIAPSSASELPFITGQSDATSTSRVTVNGSPANWTPQTAAWTYLIDSPLGPGINRFVIQSFDRSDIQIGELVAEIRLPITESVPPRSLSVEENTTWTAEHGPIRIHQDLTILPGAQLAIEAGVSIQISPEAQIIVQGELLVRGEKARPVLFSNDSTGPWTGIRFQPGSQGFFEHVLVKGVASRLDSAAITIEQAEFEGRHLVLRNINAGAISSTNSKLTLESCEFPQIQSGSVIHSIETEPDTEFLIKGCRILSSNDTSPLILVERADIDGKPIQIRDNHFSLGTSSGLHLINVPAVVLGNQFSPSRPSLDSNDPPTIIALQNQSEFQTIDLARNVFHQALQAIRCEGAFQINLHNNTFDALSESALSVDSGQISSEWINNLFRATPSLITSSNGTIDHIGVTGHNNVSDQPLASSIEHMPESEMQLGPKENRWKLLKTSPLRDAGFGDLDIGASAATAPDFSVQSSQAWNIVGNKLSLWAPGAKLFKISSLDSSQNLIEIFIPNGESWQIRSDISGQKTYTLTALDSGNQSIDTQTIELQHSPSAPSVFLSEIQTIASNTSTETADWIELANRTNQTIDLTGYQLSDDPLNPSKFTFPDGSNIPAYGFLVVRSSGDFQSPATLPFNLAPEGEVISLFDSNQIEIDQLSYGRQILNYSLSRTSAWDWKLSRPTPNAVNDFAILSHSDSISISEFLTRPTTASNSQEFVEIQNTSSLPTSLTGIQISDQLLQSEVKASFPDYSFLGPRGILSLEDAANPSGNRWPLNQGISSEPGAISIHTIDGNLIDRIWYGPQFSGISLGRTEGNSVISIARPTPGFSNTQIEKTVPRIEIPFISATTTEWQYDTSGRDQGRNWHQPDFERDSWSRGVGLFGGGALQSASLVNTPFETDAITSYFVSSFDYPGILAPASISLSLIADDGAIVYLNGKEVFRQGLPPSNQVNHTTPASEVAMPAWVEEVSINPELVQPGLNWVAVELHQAGTDIPDALFGLSINGVIDASGPENLRISEILANNQSWPLAPSLQSSDWVEIYNASPLPVDLSAILLSDNLATDRHWRFPNGSIIGSLGRRLISFDSTQPASHSNTGFGLSASGDSVFLLHSNDEQLELLDSIAFGFQASDVSLARLGATDAWSPAIPTPHAPNQAALLGEIFQLSINEWIARSTEGPDWIELYNSSGGIVDLGGSGLSDDLADPFQQVFPPYSFIDARGWKQIFADGRPQDGANHADFKLSASGESIVLTHPSGFLIDHISFGPQVTDQSEGRLPDGGSNIQPLPSPSPQQSNNLDADLDGIDDAWERRFGLDPEDPSDATDDPDKDGLNNREEFLLGTDPASAASGMQLELLEVLSDQKATFRLKTVSNRSLSIQFSPTIAEPAWEDLWTLESASTTETLQVELEIPNDVGFFRLVAN